MGIKDTNLNDTQPNHSSSHESNHIPKHVAIVMDGNGRWATAKGKHRSAGHQEGLVSAKNIVKASALRGIEYLTLYVFSTENWKRLETEVSFLMDLLVKNLRREYDFYKEHQIRLHHFGNRAGLSTGVLKEIDDSIEFTKNFSKLNLALCINYGGLDEIQRAYNKTVNISKNTNQDANLDTSDDIFSHLDSAVFPPVDLFIRTGGQVRISNFLLTQIAYSELYFTKTLWPDFKEEDFDIALQDYSMRIRNFGS